MSTVCEARPGQTTNGGPVHVQGLIVGRLTMPKYVVSKTSKPHPPPGKKTTMGWPKIWGAVDVRGWLIVAFPDVTWTPKSKEKLR